MDSSRRPVRRLKSALVTHEIPNKSILLAQVEATFTNFNYIDLVHQYTTMGFEVQCSTISYVVSCPDTCMHAWSHSSFHIYVC